MLKAEIHDPASYQPQKIRPICHTSPRAIALVRTSSVAKDTGSLISGSSIRSSIARSPSLYPDLLVFALRFLFCWTEAAI